MDSAAADDDRTREWIVGEQDAGRRIDVLLADVLDASRAHVRRIIDSGGVLIGGRPCKPSSHAAAGESVSVQLDWGTVEMPEAEPIPLDILYEDGQLVVINKPPGMVVHPGRGRWSGTLVAALAHHFQSLSSAGGADRPGIVHRLDRDTSGVIVVARNDAAHERIAEQFKARTVAKKYLAIVSGMPDRDRDWIDRPIGRHPHQRERMAIRAGHETSRDARTFYEVLERRGGYALLRAEPKTGRTHQIRLHLASIGCPVLCDRLYGGRAEITKRELLAPRGAKSSEAVPGDEAEQPILTRQALHAAELCFDHPTTDRRLMFAAPLPADMQAVLDLLRS